MVNQQKVIRFFDARAARWARTPGVDRDKIQTILQHAQIGPGAIVLDVACGTGVLVPEYFAHGAAQVTGVDISPKMIEFAKKTTQDLRAEFVCADIEKVVLAPIYDRCVVYNAFPHFSDPERLISTLARLLTAGGRLTIAHSMGRAQVNRYHREKASEVSEDLMEAECLATLMRPYFEVDAVISDEQLYLVAGKKRT